MSYRKFSANKLTTQIFCEKQPGVPVLKCHVILTFPWCPEAHMSHNLSHLWLYWRRLHVGKSLETWLGFSLSIVSFFPSFFISYNGSKFTTRVREQNSRKTVKLIRKLSSREELRAPVQRLTLIEKNLELKIHCFRVIMTESHRNSP